MFLFFVSARLDDVGEPVVTERTVQGYDPRFDLDLAYGQQGELFVADIRDGLRDGTVEVKRDGQFARTGNLYVEFECLRQGRYRPSGLTTTEAKVWVFVLGDTPACLCIATELLRAWVRLEGFPVVDCARGSHPTRGWLLGMHRVTYLLKHEGTAADGAA